MSICNHVNFFSEINHNKIICLDLGNKNIGVGISDQGLKFANPLKVIKRKKLNSKSKKTSTKMTRKHLQQIRKIYKHFCKAKIYEDIPTTKINSTMKASICKASFKYYK